MPMPGLVAGLVAAVAWAAWPALGAAADATPTGITGSAGTGGNTGITGSWASTTGPERLVFSAGGDVRSCFAGGKKGNAALGRWKTLSPGRYAVEFTHTSTADCKAPPQAIHKHSASIRGQVVISQGELALHVSGEFPPDLYRPLGRK